MASRCTRASRALQLAAFRYEAASASNARAALGRLLTQPCIYGFDEYADPRCTATGECAPQACGCDGRECGDDDCGNVCGQCADGQTCNEMRACITPAPDGWTCPQEYYADGEFCDCLCGSPDANCADPALSVFDCEEGTQCIDGACR